MFLDLTSIAGFTIEQKLLEELQHVYAVIPLANIRTDGTHGPSMTGPEGRKPVPDSMISGRRHGGLEIKAKSKANPFHNWDRLEHGIDKRAWLAYLAFAREYKLPVYLLIAELSTGALLMQDLDTLRSAGRPRPGTDKKTGKEMINWDRRVFANVGAFAVPNGDLRNIIVTWDRSAINAFMGQLSLELETA